MNVLNTEQEKIALDCVRQLWSHLGIPGSNESTVRSAVTLGRSTDRAEFIWSTVNDMMTEKISGAAPDDAATLAMKFNLLVELAGLYRMSHDGPDTLTEATPVPMIRTPLMDRLLPTRDQLTEEGLNDAASGLRLLRRVSKDPAVASTKPPVRTIEDGGSEQDAVQQGGSDDIDDTDDTDVTDVTDVTDSPAGEEIPAEVESKEETDRQVVSEDDTAGLPADLVSEEDNRAELTAWRRRQFDRLDHSLSAEVFWDHSVAGGTSAGSVKSKLVSQVSVEDSFATFYGVDATETRDVRRINAALLVAAQQQATDRLNEIGVELTNPNGKIPLNIIIEQLLIQFLNDPSGVKASESNRLVGIAAAVDDHRFAEVSRGIENLESMAEDDKDTTAELKGQIEDLSEHLDTTTRMVAAMFAERLGIQRFPSTVAGVSAGAEGAVELFESFSSSAESLRKKEYEKEHRSM